MLVQLSILAVLLIAAIAPTFSAPDSGLRALRMLPMLLVYPLFIGIAATNGLKVAGAMWLAFAAAGFLLELLADWRLPAGKRRTVRRNLYEAAIAWPLTIPAALETLLIGLGMAVPPAPPKLPIPARGDDLFALSNDEMLVGAYQILSGPQTLTADELTVLIVETFNREVHGGGFKQWFANTDHSVSETAAALDAVGAAGFAELLRRSPSVPANELDEQFYALERERDLTAQIADFVRRSRATLPSLNAVPESA